MSAPTTAIFHQPTFKIFPTLSSRFNSLNRFSFPKIHSSKSGFTGGFVSNRSVFEKNRVRTPITMSEVIRTSSFGSSNDDEGVTALEQEAFINGSSQIVAAGGFEATLNRLSKWLVAALFGGIILWRHDVEALWAAMGSILNAGLSVALKKILNQERPVATLRSDPGMPSSHSQSIFYSVMFAILSMVEWLGVNEVTLAVGVVVLAFGSYLSWLRVSQHFHTISQVLVGAAVGSIFSILWLWSWRTLVLQAFVSFLWVRIFVITGAVGLCLGFLIHVVRYWLMDDEP